MDTAHIVELVRAEIEDCPRGVLFAYVFGSVARGTARADSDVDVGVVLPSKPVTLEQLPLDLQAALERRLARTVQVVALNGADPDLIHRVLRDGVLVYEANRSARIAFEVASRNAYFDLLPYRQQYRNGGRRT